MAADGSALDRADAGSFVAFLDEAQRADLLEAGRSRRYSRGTAVFYEGDDSDEVIVVVSGRAKISCATEDGKEVVLAIRGPGDLLGEMSAFDGEPRASSVFALEDLEVLLLSNAEFTRFLERHPRVALMLLQMQTERLRDADRKRVGFLAQDSVGRVAARLVEMCERYGETNEQGFRISLPLSQEELAGWTGASREAVSKALQLMRQKGWIETHRRGATIIDLDALKRRAR